MSWCGIDRKDEEKKQVYVNYNLRVEVLGMGMEGFVKDDV